MMGYLTGGVNLLTIEEDYQMTIIKKVTCNECGFKFDTIWDDKDIKCLQCKGNKSFSIRFVDEDWSKLGSLSSHEKLPDQID